MLVFVRFAAKLGLTESLERVEFSGSPEVDERGRAMERKRQNGGVMDASFVLLSDVSWTSLEI